MKPLNDHGQASIAALVILPVALAIFMTLFILGAALSIEARAVAACRESMRQSQETASEAISHLERLNPVAQNLEHMRRATDVAWNIARLSMNPQAMATAQAARLVIQSLQRPVQAKQKYWYLRGKTASLMAPAKALRAMQASLPKGFSGRIPELRAAQFHLIQSPPGARTPVYRPAPSFTRTQNARAQWLLALPVERVHDGAIIPKLRVGCEMTLASTLKKGAVGKWMPQITEDKLLRN